MAGAWKLGITSTQCLPTLQQLEVATHSLWKLRLVQGSRRCRRWLIITCRAQHMLPVAVDALGGDKAPAEIVEGAKQAVAAGIPVLLVGPADLARSLVNLPLHVATEFIDMHEDPASSVRNKKDSTLVVSADLVRDGIASAMISAGNTGATMASALLRMGRIKGVKRPAIATPIPVPGSTPTVMLDAGANAEVEAEWMTQFAVMGSVYAQCSLRH